MEFAKVSKAIAAGVGGAVATGIVTTAIIPADVQAPWWGYVVAYAVATAVPALVTYFAPKNAN